LSCEMSFWRLIEPISTGQLRAVMAQTVMSSDFVLDIVHKQYTVGRKY
jgi:hypothetical protein